MAIIQKTLQDLRTFSGTPTLGDNYYLTNPGMEGMWYYDGTSSLNDNTGTILTSGWNYGTTPPTPPTTASPQFRRIYDAGTVNALWFHETFDLDETPCIQRALDFISDTTYVPPTIPPTPVPFGGGTVFLPKATYYISAPLRIAQHCRLLGVAKSGASYYNNNTGSLILVNLPRDASKDFWAIESATYISGSPLGFNSFCDDGSGTTETHGIIIENISIFANQIYGGIRLTSSPYSVIRNVSVYNARIGIYLNNCWNCSVEDSYIRKSQWYGVVLAETNVCSIMNTAVTGDGFFHTSTYFLISFSDGEEENEGPKPLFIPDFTDSGLDNKAELGRTGIYICQNGNANEIFNCSSEIFTNGIISIDDCNTSINTAYIEDIIYYGIINGKDEALAQINTVYFEKIGIQIPNTNPVQFDTTASYPFYFGQGSSVEVVAANCMRYADFVGDLFKVGDDDVYVTFSNTKYITRKYAKQVLFIDETPYGANFGSVYIDPDAGSDINYGFNENDPIQTFDAALVRVQNQSTINPVKVIYVKAAPLVSEEGSLATGAAIKNLDIVPIENADVLITTYGVDPENNKLRGRIYFEGDISEVAMIGQIKLLGNVNLYFRNVDLATNTPLALGTINQSMFGLDNSYAKVTFESNYVPTSPSSYLYGNIYLDYPYYLFEPVQNTSNPFSLLDVKFVNIEVVGGFGLSYTYSGATLLGVDCVQINSLIPAGYYLLPNNGWKDSTIIRDNF